MYRCPRCLRPLVNRPSPGGLLLACSEDHGVAVALPVLCKLTDAPFRRQAWPSGIRILRAASVPCPVCRKRMEEVAVPVGKRTVQVDLCRACQFIWFDRGELESLPKARPGPKPKLTPRFLPSLEGSRSANAFSVADLDVVGLVVELIVGLLD